MAYTNLHHHLKQTCLLLIRNYSRIRPPPPAPAVPVIRVNNNISHLGSPKEKPKPRQVMYLPPFPSHPLPGKNLSAIRTDRGESSSSCHRVTAISWVKYYFDDIPGDVIWTLFTKNLVEMECATTDESGKEKDKDTGTMKKIKPNDAMEPGAKIYLPVSVAETKISRRFDSIPSGTLYPNADEIEYLKRLVLYKDAAIIILNKPPKLPIKGNLPVHNSMDALGAAALSYDYDEGPKLVHRLDRESSGLLVMGRTKESVSRLQGLFSDINRSEIISKHGRTTYQKYWALVIGSPKEKQGLICAPLTKVLLDNGKTERVTLAHQSGFQISQEAITEYRVLGPMVNGCSWIELCPYTSRKHQLRVHCAEALGTPIVGDYKYGWFVHRRWKQMPRVDIEPTTGQPYKMRRPDGLDVQKGSVLSKVPLLHLHCRETVLPNIAKSLAKIDQKSRNREPDLSLKPDVLRFVAPMPSHMKISWNLMSSYLI